MYDKIVNPMTGRKVLLNGKIGRQVLNNYLQQLGGKFIGSGTYKCVFSPPIKCNRKSKRYGDKAGDSPNNYVSTVMSVKDANDEIAELNKLLPIIDPNGEYTLNVLSKCKLGDLDAMEEPRGDFAKCSSMETYSGEYPYGNRKRSGAPRDDDLVQLIFHKGGVDLSVLYKNILDSGLNGIDVKDLLIGFTNVLNGVKKMSDAGYIHSDIKPPNILYNKDSKKYFLIDFGLALKKKELVDKAIYYDYTIGADDGVGYRYWPQDSGWTWVLHQVLKSNPREEPALKRRLNEYYSIDTITDLELFKESSLNKFDVYSLGFIFLEFLNSNIIRLISHPQVDELIEDINKLRASMLRGDPIARPSIESVIETYKAIMVKYFPREFAPAPPKTPVEPPAPPAKSKKKIIKVYKKTTTAAAAPKTVKCEGRKKGPKGKTCKSSKGKGCCLDEGVKEHCKWISGSKGKPGKCVNK